MVARLMTCAGAMALLAGPASAETMTLWSRSGQGETIPALVKAFNESHEDQVQVVQVPFQEMVQKYATALAGGEAPDAVALDLIYTPSFAASGQLEPLTDWAKSLSYFDSLSKAHLSVATYQGDIYGMPFTTETSVMAWNKDLFEKAGLDPEKGPTNYAEWRDMAKRVDALGDDIDGFYFSGNCAGCTIFSFTPMIWASNGRILSDDGSKATLDTPQMHDAVDLFRNMIADGSIAASARTDNGTNFLSIQNGRIGMQVVGAATIGVLTTQHPDLNFGVAPIPGKDGGSSTFVGGDNFVITKGSDHVDLAKTFLEFAYSPEGQTLMAKYGSLPARSDISAKIMADQDSRLQVAAATVPTGHTPYSVVFNDIINSANSPWIQMLSAAIYGDDPDAAIAEGERQMQETIDFGS
ncbi:ABC transporter substrate-binding protein [Fulvimarina manganoxydans]|uniref:ABC transporter substrate-binding protein n=1 Tax=Fulvimarina manganoxydans TaxID=937218 RepID=UPI000A019A36